MDARCGTWFQARLRVGMGPSSSIYTDLIERTAQRSVERQSTLGWPPLLLTLSKLLALNLSLSRFSFSSQ